MTASQAQEQLVQLEEQISRLSGQRVLLMLRAMRSDLVEKPADELISLKEAAQKIGVSRVWFYRNPKLPFLRKINGKRTMVSMKALEQWCETRRSR
jgi:predicted DNA-binding transcriptional regulator AlpA